MTIVSAEEEGCNGDEQIIEVIIFGNIGSLTINELNFNDAIEIFSVRINKTKRRDMSYIALDKTFKVFGKIDNILKIKNE